MKLNPKTGIDNLKFGMTRKEVLPILGEPNRTLVDEDDENSLTLEWNDKKMRLTFYQNLNDKLGYLRNMNPELKFNGKNIIGKEIDNVKNEIFGDLISDWEIDDYEFFQTHFNEECWLTLGVEYGVVTNFEMGVPFKNDEDYDWPE